MVTEVYKVGIYHVIKINEVLHLTSNIDELVDIVDDLLKNNVKNFAISFQDNSYLYSKTGSVIVRCWEKIQDQNGNLTLINTNDDIRDFLAVIDIELLIKKVGTEEELL
jgi:hypothetical protein